MRLQTIVMAAAAVLLLLVSVPSAAQQLPQNKDVFDTVCRIDADSLLGSAGAHSMSRLQVRLIGGERTSFFRSVFMDAARAYSVSVYDDGAAADTIATFGIEDVQVSYGPAFREHWFGEQKTGRTAAVTVRLEMRQRSTGKILYAGTVRHSAIDTIAVDEIARLSASSRHIAFGDPPGPSLWEQLLEPAIVTVSSGIAIYLFFTVRS